MALLDEEINLGDIEIDNNFEPIPDGWYPVKIKSADLKTTKDGFGKYIAVGYQVQGEKFNGRVVFENVNIKNRNPEAERIGKQGLAQIGAAIGIARLTDSDQLIGGNLQIKVNTEKSEGYEPRNGVRGHKAIEGSTPPMPMATTSQPTSSPPWAKKQ